MTHVEPLREGSRGRTNPPSSAKPWLLRLQMFPGPNYWQVATPFWRNIERTTSPGIHASELTHWDVSQEASWEVGGSQEEGEGVEGRWSTGEAEEMEMILVTHGEGLKKSRFWEKELQGEMVGQRGFMIVKLTLELQ